MKSYLKNHLSRPSLILSLLVSTLPISAIAADTVVRGPVWTGTVRNVGRNPDDVLAMKGIVVRLSGEKKAYICYDADLLRVSMAWTGDFLEFGNTLTQIQWPPPPQVKGKPAFATKMGPGWAIGTDFTDPRLRHQGPLPKDWAHYRGLYLNGDQVILSYTVGKMGVLELPGFGAAADQPIFTRSFKIEKSSEAISLMVAEMADGKSDITDATIVQVKNADGSLAIAAGISGAPAGATFAVSEGRIILRIPAHKNSETFKISIWGGEADKFSSVRTALSPNGAIPDLSALCKGGPARWTAEVVTKGSVGVSSNDAYVVDLLTEPSPNPYNIKTFFGGFDFLPDGRAALCTFHGDVWIVSGLDDKLEKLTWKRFANGLFQPLGLKVVDGLIHVLGRDQITRLHDLNKDGEADFYENFNNDCVVTANYHEFTLDLHTDSHGNFFYCKGAPWEPNVTSPHQGTMIKVSKDGSKSEIYATGFRAPNGMTIGPKDTILVGDNQGHWMPSSKLNLVRKGGFYGMMPAAQRELTFQRGGTNFTANPSDPAQRNALKIAPFGGQSPIPISYDQPIAWVPYGVDNSSGGQVFVTSKKWGPFQGHALFESYGKCTLFLVMMEEIEGVTQAGMVQFPLKFDSGLMRARFNAHDGQLYVSGLRGWQSSATRDGGFYRVRYNGRPVHMPVEFHAHKNGIRLTFTTPLDPASAADRENWTADEWNIKYSGNYGSPELSLQNPGKTGHDKVEIKAVHLSRDRKSVFLETDELEPVHQFRVKYKITSADGVPIAQEFFATLHKLGPPEILAVK